MQENLSLRDHYIRSERPEHTSTAAEAGCSPTRRSAAGCTLVCYPRIMSRVLLAPQIRDHDPRFASSIPCAAGTAEYDSGPPVKKARVDSRRALARVFLLHVMLLSTNEVG